MLFNSTELNDANPIEEYTHEPTRWETVVASMDNFTAVNLSTSEMNDYKDQVEVTKAEWIKENPNNEKLYNRILGVDKKILEQLDTLYESGDYEAIENWNTSSNTGMVNIGGMGIGKDYLKFRDTQNTLGLTNVNELRQTANDTALNDYKKSKEVLDASEFWGMEMIGTMAGALQDPVTLATLPMGSFKSGGTILSNAGKAFLEEAKIEAMAQTVIAPKAYGFKTELGIKTSIATEATNAVTAIVGAGAMRGLFSSTFDLTEAGIKALKMKDPELGADYEQLVKSQVTDDVKTHIDNMQRVEFGDDIIEIKNPNAKGQEINNADYLSETSSETTIKAREAQPLKVEGAEMKIHSGVDETGEPIYKSYKELNDEVDIEAAYIQKAKDCAL